MATALRDVFSHAQKREKTHALRSGKNEKAGLEEQTRVRPAQSHPEHLVFIFSLFSFIVNQPGQGA